MLLLKFIPNFDSSEKRDNFIIYLLSITLILWLLWWIVPRWTGNPNDLNNQFGTPQILQQQEDHTLTTIHSTQIVDIKEHIPFIYKESDDQILPLKH